MALQLDTENNFMTTPCNYWSIGQNNLDYVNKTGQVVLYLYVSRADYVAGKSAIQSQVVQLTTEMIPNLSKSDPLLLRTIYTALMATPQFSGATAVFEGNQSKEIVSTTSGGG